MFRLAHREFSISCKPHRFGIFFGGEHAFGNQQQRKAALAPRATITRSASCSGRCSALASSHDARIHTSYSSSVVRITGMAFGWIGSTIAFGAVVRTPYTR
jgi:hypothetical protein